MTRQIIVYAIIFGFIPAGLIAALIGGMFDLSLSETLYGWRAARIG
jgi:hypothetical protein